jgi:predicted  nucleic acid-binding Zn-ribbon protein
MIEVFVFVGFLLILGLLIVYFYMRDQAVTKQLSAYEKAIDELNRRFHKLELESKETADDDVYARLENFTHELEAVEERLNQKLNDLSDPLLKAIRAIKQMEIEMHRINESLNERISKIEENNRLSNISATSKLINEKAIIELYKNGYSAEEIAKRERTPLGEVELILKIANLK